MASASINKTQKISDFRFREEESVYERLQRITSSAKKFHSQNGLNHNDNLSLKGDIGKYLAEQKEKVRRTVLLHGGFVPL